MFLRDSRFVGPINAVLMISALSLHASESRHDRSGGFGHTLEHLQEGILVKTRHVGGLIDVSVSREQEKFRSQEAIPGRGTGDSSHR